MSSLLFWMVCQVPQLIKNYKRGSAEALSVWFLAEWLLGDVLNFAGSYLVGVVPTQLYLAGLFVVMDTIILTQYIYYAIKNRNKPTTLVAEGSDSEGEDDEARALLRLPGKANPPPAAVNGVSEIQDPAAYTPPKGTINAGDPHSGRRQSSQGPLEFSRQDDTRENAGESARSSSGDENTAPQSYGTNAHFVSRKPAALAVTGSRCRCGVRTLVTSLAVPAMMVAVAGPLWYRSAQPVTAQSSQLGARVLSEGDESLSQWFPARRYIPPFFHAGLVRNESVTWQEGAPSGNVARRLDIKPCKGKPIPHGAAVAGAVLGWISSALYLMSRLPQIYKNCVRQNVEGLSWLMFMCAFLGNLTSTLGIVMRATTPSDWVSEAPFLPGMMGTIGFDFTIMLQYAIYSKRAEKRREERAALRAQADIENLTPNARAALEDTPMLPHAERHGLFDMVESPHAPNDLEQARRAVQRRPSR